MRSELGVLVTRNERLLLTELARRDADVPAKELAALEALSHSGAYASLKRLEALALVSGTWVMSGPKPYQVYRCTASGRALVTPSNSQQTRGLLMDDIQISGTMLQRTMQDHWLTNPDSTATMEQGHCICGFLTSHATLYGVDRRTGFFAHLLRVLAAVTEGATA